VTDAVVRPVKQVTCAHPVVVAQIYGGGGANRAPEDRAPEDREMRCLLCGHAWCVPIRIDYAEFVRELGLTK
jgi:hypothetical protein